MLAASGSRMASAKLFEKYFTNARLSVHMLETGESIARELEQVVDVLRGAGEQTRDYGETLGSVIRADAAALDPDFDWIGAMARRRGRLRAARVGGSLFVSFQAQRARSDRCEQRDRRPRQKPRSQSFQPQRTIGFTPG